MFCKRFGDRVVFTAANFQRSLNRPLRGRAQLIPGEISRVLILNLFGEKAVLFMGMALWQRPGWSIRFAGLDYLPRL